MEAVIALEEDRSNSTSNGDRVVQHYIVCRGHRRSVLQWMLAIHSKC